MKRRTLLAAAGTLGTALAAGCVGARGPIGTDAPETPTGTPSATFEVTDRGCGRGENEATVRFEGDAVIVEGTIGGSDTCDTATLESVRMSDGRVIVTVAVVPETTGTPACGQCITDIEYTARIHLAGEPAGVTVRHGSETVARVDR